MTSTKYIGMDVHKESISIQVMNSVGKVVMELHYHEERNHQGKGNRILFPLQTKARRKEGAVQCRERLGGLLKYYEREAA